MTPGAEDEDDGVLVLDSDSQGDDDGIAASQGFEVSSSPEQPYMIDDESSHESAEPAEPAKPAKQVKEKSWMMEVGIEACAAEHKMPRSKGGLAEGGCMDYTSTSLRATGGSEINRMRSKHKITTFVPDILLLEHWNRRFESFPTMYRSGGCP